MNLQMEAGITGTPVSYTHLRAHETGRNLVCRLLLEKKKKKETHQRTTVHEKNKRKNLSLRERQT